MDSIGHAVIGTLGIVLLLFGGNNALVVIEKPDESCSILVNGSFAEPQPLILSPDPRSNGAFIYPSEPGSGRLGAELGESFRLACPGSQLQIDTMAPRAETLVTCFGNNKFILDGLGIEASFDKISCEKYPESVARRTRVLCKGGSMLEIGFSLSSETKRKQKRGEFHPIIDLCRDYYLSHTIYAHAKIIAGVDDGRKKFSKTPFRKGGFFHGIEMSEKYTRESQRASIALILNSTSLASKYIAETGPYFFSEGHLIAKEDFIYVSHQLATFYYVNTVPMWQNINAGNWATMEATVRTLASKRNIDLDVWVGGYGILNLRDEKGVKRKIFLHDDDKRGRSVPVPKILFKVVYHYPSRSGVVFLTANNPYLTELTEEYRICKDVCQNIKYIKWNHQRPDQGLSYCCEIDDFRRPFPNIPDFETKYLL